MPYVFFRFESESVFLDVCLVATAAQYGKRYYGLWSFVGRLVSKFYRFLTFGYVITYLYYL